MSDDDIDCLLLSRSRILKENIEHMYETLLNEYSDISTSFSISDLVEQTYDFLAYIEKYGKKKCGSFLLFKEKIRVIIVNCESQSSNEYMYGGIKQVYILLSSSEGGGSWHIFQNQKEISHGFIPIFSTICQELDIYLAIAAHENDILWPEWSTEISPKSLDYLIEKFGDSPVFWSTFYFDNEIYFQIDKTKLKKWATIDIPIGNNSHFLSRLDKPFISGLEGDLSIRKRKDKIYSKYIYPVISQRIREEYSSPNIIQ